MLLLYTGTFAELTVLAFVWPSAFQIKSCPGEFSNGLYVLRTLTYCMATQSLVILSVHTSRFGAWDSMFLHMETVFCTFMKWSIHIKALLDLTLSIYKAFVPESQTTVEDTAVVAFRKRSLRQKQWRGRNQPKFYAAIAPSNIFDHNYQKHELTSNTNSKWRESILISVFRCEVHYWLYKKFRNMSLYLTYHGSYFRYF